MTTKEQNFIFKDLIIDETTQCRLKGVGPDILCASKIIFSISGTLMFPKETNNDTRM